MNAYIVDLAYYLPERVVTNEEIVKEFPEWSVEKIASKVGVNQRHIAAIDETASDMAVKAAELLFHKGNVNKEDVDYILFCTQSPDYFLPSSSCIIQRKLGLRTDIGALDFNLGCSGYVYGLSLAKGLVVSGVANQVLLLTAETYNKHIHPKDKGNRTIFGDAATASIIGREGIAQIGNFQLGTNGDGAENLIVRTGGMRYPQKANDLTFDDKNGTPLSSDNLFMDGGEIYVFTLLNVPRLIKKTLANNVIQKEQIDLYVLHQANKYMLDVLKEKCKIEDTKFYYCLSEVGNTVSNSIPIALSEALKDSTIQKGMNVLLAGFGVGYSWGGTILKF